MKKVEMHTDGACSGNPGPGGIGVVLVWNGHEKTFSEGYDYTTNNRMELMAVIKGFEMLTEGCIVQVYSDSTYVVKSFKEKWIDKWIENNWKKSAKSKKDVANQDLWKILLKLMEQHEVSFNWVKGHSDNEYNNRCDRLAFDASRGDAFLIDNGYIDSLNKEGEKETTQQLDLF